MTQQQVPYILLKFPIYTILIAIDTCNLESPRDPGKIRALRQAYSLWLKGQVMGNSAGQKHFLPCPPYPTQTLCCQWELSGEYRHLFLTISSGSPGRHFLTADLVSTDSLIQRQQMPQEDTFLSHEQHQQRGSQTPGLLPFAGQQQASQVGAFLFHCSVSGHRAGSLFLCLPLVW